jgi:hypothetical protein
MGYTFESEKILTVKGEVVRAPVREHVAPDVTAQIFWLKNRQPDRWREKQQMEHTGKDGGPIQTKTELDFGDLEPNERDAIRAILGARSREPEKGID